MSVPRCSNIISRSFLLGSFQTPSVLAVVHTSPFWNKIYKMRFKISHILAAVTAASCVVSGWCKFSSILIDCFVSKICKLISNCRLYSGNLAEQLALSRIQQSKTYRCCSRHRASYYAFGSFYHLWHTQQRRKWLSPPTCRESLRHEPPIHWICSKWQYGG